MPPKHVVRNARDPEGSHNGIAAVLKTAARKGVRVRIPRPPQGKASYKRLAFLFDAVRLGMKYVAFLRGINVGGNNPIKMDSLKKTFVSMGFTDVRTILASGNVLFDTNKKNFVSLTAEIEKKLDATFGKHIGVLLRTIESLHALASADPFKNISVTPQTRLYVTFLPDDSAKKSITTSDKHFKIVKALDSEICSVLTLSEERNTVDLMNILEKEFGKKITTRNWNTVMRILKAK